MTEITQGFYKVENTAIFVTQDQFIWKYSWFYYENDDVYLVALEYKTNTTYTTSIESKPGEDLTPRFQEVLNKRTESIKVNI